MKLKNLLLSFLLVSVAGPALACDGCGSGAGSPYIGMLPAFPEKIIGLRYSANALTNHLSPKGQATYLTTEEHFNTLEIWGAWTIRRKVRILAQFPLAHQTRQSRESEQSKAGIGDLAVSGYYRLMDVRSIVGDSLRKALLQHTLWLGGGLKAPTGHYEPADQINRASGLNLFQSGSGSWDLLLTGMYDMRLSNAGLSLVASYRINTLNRYGYHYGNSMTGIARLHYAFRLPRENQLTVPIGVRYEQSGKDLDKGLAVHASGGRALYGSIGLEWNRKRMAAGFSWEPVLTQDIGAGMVRTANRAMAHIALML